MSQPAAAIQLQPQETVLRGLRDTGAGLAIGLVVLGLLFHAEIAAAVSTWIASTAYNHCFVIIPIVGYLIWDRRACLQGLPPAPLPFAALLVLPAGLAWLAAERLGIMEGRQLAAMSMVEVLFLAVFGQRLWQALSGPLLYLFFLVPFGDFLTPQLQDFTSWFTGYGLAVLGIPAYADGNIIEIPEGTFFVAEACAGLRFLIASIAFGVLYALLMYRSTGRRTVFVVASVIVPIIANGFRALGIVVLGHVLGSAQAAATDHVLYGWMFFSVVILLLILLGMPFRQDEPSVTTEPSPRLPNPGVARAGVLAGLAVAVLAALGPATVLGLNRASAMPEAALRPLDLSPSCVNQGSPGLPAAGAQGNTIVQRVRCGGTDLNIEIEVYPSRSTAAPINGERRRLTRPAGVEDLSETPVLTDAGAALPGWRFVLGNDPGFVAASALWIDGTPATPGLRTRLEMARTSITGVAHAPVLVVITPVVDWRNVDVAKRQSLERLIAALLDLHPEILEQIKTLAEMPR